MKLIEAKPIRVRRPVSLVASDGGFGLEEMEMGINEYDRTDGLRLQQARQHAGLGLLAAAKLLSLRPSELSQLEWGSLACDSGTFGDLITKLQRRN